MKYRVSSAGLAPKNRRSLATSLAIFSAAPGVMAAPTTEDIHTAVSRAHVPHNPGIVRSAHGEYEYRSISDDHLTGTETFDLTVAPNGVRTMRANTDIFSRGVQANVVLRADRSFRPLDAYVGISTNGELKGSGFYVAGSDTLDAMVVDAAGRQTHSHITVPARFSLGTHPLSLDGWSSWYLDQTPGKVTRGSIYLINGDAKNDRPMLGTITPVDLEYIGSETITVPAGTFQTDHFRIANASELWVTGQDRLLVKYVWAAIDRQYLLTKLSLMDNRQGDELNNGGPLRHDH